MLQYNNIRQDFRHKVINVLSCTMYHMFVSYSTPRDLFLCHYVCYVYSVTTASVLLQSHDIMDL